VNLHPAPSHIDPAHPGLAAARAAVAQIGTLLFQRNLTDAAGGNVSLRVPGAGIGAGDADVLCMTPRYAGSHHFWALAPEDVLVVSLDGQVLAGEGTISREAKVHLRLHNTYGEAGKAVVHCHPRHVLVFAAMAMPIPPVLEATRKFGEIPVIPYAPSHSNALAEHVAAGMAGKEALMRRQAAAVIAPWHGLFVMGADLNLAFDAAERIDTNAHILLMGRQLGADPTLSEQRAAMEAAIAGFVDIGTPAQGAAALDGE
jgi:L-fuculose-phosphate aldolase